MTAMMAHNTISRWSGALGVCAIIAVIRPAHADPRAVIELFTSQGCSSCPPADNILGELAKDPSVIALSMPIDYWDYLGWKDTLADARFSARQKAYSRVRGDREVYTPQVVVNGSAHVIGSDRAGIENAIHTTKQAEGVMSVPVTMTQAGKEINVSVAARTAAARSPTTMWCATCSRWATGTELPAAGRCPWKIFPARASMLRWSMSRTAAATSPVRCWGRPSRRCTEALSHSGTGVFAWTRNPEVVGTSFRVRASARPGMTGH